MPKSKRERLVTLSESNYKRNTRDQKSSLIQKVRDCVEKYARIYVFSVEGYKSKHVGTMRRELRDSVIMLTKNQVMKVALGKSEQDEYQPNLHKVSEHLHGLVGLLFTNMPHNDVVEYFSNFSVKECAVKGFQVDQQIKLKAGKVEWMPGSFEEHLALLGVPIKVSEGCIEVLYDFIVCNPGDRLTSNQAKILEKFGYELAEFKPELVFKWENGETESSPF